MDEEELLVELDELELDDEELLVELEEFELDEPLPPDISTKSIFARPLPLVASSRILLVPAERETLADVRAQLAQAPVP